MQHTSRIPARKLHLHAVPAFNSLPGPDIRSRMKFSCIRLAFPPPGHLLTSASVIAVRRARQQGSLYSCQETRSRNCR